MEETSYIVKSQDGRELLFSTKPMKSCLFFNPLRWIWTEEKADSIFCEIPHGMVFAIKEEVTKDTPIEILGSFDKHIDNIIEICEQSNIDYSNMLKIYADMV